MGYSLRTRSASKSDIETPKKTAANKPAVKKTAPAKKTIEIKKVEKKTETKKIEKKAGIKKIEKKTEIKKVVDAKKPSEPKKPAAKQAAKKVNTPKPVAKKAEVKAAPKEAKIVELEDVKAADKTEAKKAAALKKALVKASTVKKAIIKPLPAKKAATVKSSATKKATTVSKPAAKKAASTLKRAPIRKIAAPIVKIEEITIPSLPEIETISHEEPEEKIIELVEGQVVSTHIRFSDDEADDVEMSETVEASKDISIALSDFEALDDIKEEPTHFELYNSESETEEFDKDKVSKDEFDEEEIIEDVKKESPIINAHSAFDAFTSQEGPKTFNWNNSGSTYYQKPADPVEETKVVESVEPIKEKLVTIEEKSTVASAPTVISNPFGFGFTINNVSVSSAPAPVVATSRPNPFSFNSHFQSISSPLDKLCNLTSKANPLSINSNNFSFGTSSMGNSSFLPTSPAAGFIKAVKSPSDHGEDKEERSPSVIQSIIIDDKHEDFSAF